MAKKAEKKSEAVAEDTVEKIVLSYEGLDGRQHVEEFDLATFGDRLRCVEVTQAIVSCQETRSRRQYESAQKFVSLTLNFSGVWDLVRLADAASSKAARQQAFAYIKEQIMNAEAIIGEMIAHQLMKDGLNAYRRDPSNPYVANSSDLKAADLAAVYGRKAPLPVVGANISETEKTR